jgi:hypothetical protein
VAGVAGPTGSSAAFDGATLKQASTDLAAYIAGVPRWGAYLNASALQIRISADPAVADVNALGVPSVGWNTNLDQPGSGWASPPTLFARNVVTNTAADKHWYQYDHEPCWLELDYGSIVYLSGVTILNNHQGGGYLYMPASISVQARASPTDAWTTVTTWATHKASTRNRGAIGWSESVNYSNITFADHANTFAVTGRRYWRINFLQPREGFTISNVVMWGFK